MTVIRSRFTPTGSMHHRRFLHSAISLSDGRVFVVGGLDSAGLNASQPADMHTSSFQHRLPGMDVAASPFNAVSVVESYREEIGQWALEPPLPEALSGAGLVQLDSQKLLVVAGSDEWGSIASAYLYDPDTLGWTATGGLHTPRFGHTSTMLGSGKVLVVGGNNLRPPNNGQVLDGVEVYDPSTGVWSKETWLPHDCMNHTATRLSDGRVLVLGGYSGRQNQALSNATVYDPDTRKWAPVRPLPEPRMMHTATLLDDGRVLVCGGTNEPFGLSQQLGFIYNPPQNTWCQTETLATHIYHSATVLKTGEVLVCGNASLGFDAPPELFHPDTAEWIPAGRMETERFYHTASGLPSGNVLLAGGLAPTSHPQPMEQAELYVRD